MLFLNFCQEMEVPFSHHWNITNIYKTKKLPLLRTQRFYMQHLLRLLLIKKIEANIMNGGLTVNRDNGVGKLADVSWGTSGHTDSNVNIYAFGDWAKWLNDKEIDNEEVFKLSFYWNGNGEDILDLNFNDEYFLVNSACTSSINIMIMLILCFIIVIFSM